jgi:hypothetical protein
MAKGIDWIKVEGLFRAGVLSIRDIARQCHLSECAIRRRATIEEWKRDLAPKVKASTRERLIVELAGGVVGTDEETVEKAALTQVNVVREHKKTISAARSLTMQLIAELSETTTNIGEIENTLDMESEHSRRRAAMKRAVSLASRAATMRDLATACRTWVGLERQAFSIVEEKTSPPTSDDGLTAEEATAALYAELVDLGVQLPLADGEDHPKGVVGRKTMN